MQRIPFNLRSIRVARNLRAGAEHEAIRRTFGMSRCNVQRVEAAYRDIPDALLARIENLMNDRERLRHVISTLLEMPASN